MDIKRLDYNLREIHWEVIDTICPLLNRPRFSPVKKILGGPLSAAGGLYYKELEPVIYFRTDLEKLKGQPFTDQEVTEIEYTVAHETAHYIHFSINARAKEIRADGVEEEIRSCFNEIVADTLCVLWLENTGLIRKYQGEIKDIADIKRKLNWESKTRREKIDLANKLVRITEIDFR